MGDPNDAFMRNNNAAVQARTKAQNRANVMQLKLIGQSHPTGLTANLLKLFEPRPPLEFKPPPEKRKCPPYTGMAQFVSNFAEPGDPEYAPPVKEVETPTERRARIHKLRLEKGAEKAAEELEKYDPNNDPNATGDPYKTLFVSRLNYETTESRIKREFEAYGPIKRVRLVTDKTNNKPRGYAFIEYVHTRDMKAAYKQADGKKIDNRRVLVDVERGRTVPNWRPRRLGGGLGTTRVGNEDPNQRSSGREQVQPGGPSRSEEPRIRDDRERDREKDRGRDRDREKERDQSRERSHDRPRDREHRDERHHRDRDRNRDREKDRGRDRDREKERDRDRVRDRDRERGKDRDRDRDKERERDRHREKDRDRGRDYEFDVDNDRGRSRDRDYDYDHEQDRHGEKERNYDHAGMEDDQGWYEQSDLGHRRSEGDRDRGHYDYYDHHQSREYDNQDARGDDDRYKDSGRDRYEQMEDDDYAYGRAGSEPSEKDRDYRKSDRPSSREYEY
nr:U1 small nuclear ribonucleoprotein 70 kDa [Ipomoea batatas]